MTTASSMTTAAAVLTGRTVEPPCLVDEDLLHAHPAYAEVAVQHRVPLVEQAHDSSWHLRHLDRFRTKESTP